VLEENIHRAVEDVDDSYTPDCDGVPAYLLKHCIEVLCVPLKILFDKSLSSGHFPKNNIANYRPIAKISNIAKLFERIVAHKLSFPVKTYISNSQHGFVAGRSNTTNLAVFSNFAFMPLICDLRLMLFKLILRKPLTKLATVPYWQNWPSWVYIRRY